MKTSSLCIIFLSLLVPHCSARYQSNLFLQTCRLVAQELNETECWVCALMPAHQGTVFPLQAVPAGLTELLSEHPGKPTDRLDQTVLVVQHQASFPVCFQGPARPETPDLGTTSNCQATVLRSAGELSVSGELPPSLLPFFPTPSNVSSSPSPRLYPLLTAACRVWKLPFAACLSVDLWEAQEDLYWICGTLAYKKLPETWSGSCALGHVVPAIRVTKERPAGRVRNARDLQQSTDIINTYQPLTNLDLYGGALFPSIGILKTGWAIYRLQAIIELLTNETAVTLETIAIEQRELRRLALQNRMALDIILASSGGVCALIGEECCVFVPDSSVEVFDHAKHIASLGALPKDASHDWLLSIKEWLGSWWGQIATYLIIATICLLVLIVFCKLLCCFLSCNHTTQPLLPHLLSADVPPETEIEIETILDMYAIELD